MDRLEAMFLSALAALSRLLDPVVAALARLEFAVRGQLGQMGVSPAWIGPLITVAWVILVLMAAKLVSGWPRALLLLLVAVVALKAYGYLPG